MLLQPAPTVRGGLRSPATGVVVPWLTRTAKRVVDVVGAALLLVVLLPVMLLIAMAIRATSPGPAIFRHTRIGRDGRTFECLKFRTMVEDAEDALEELLVDPARRAEFQESHKLRDDPRITRLGATLRRTSLDELPQFLNVLRGEMSLVGPRPVVRDELSRYGAAVGHYLAVRPGITGEWQSSGRSDVGFDGRVELDRRYVDGIGLVRDARILLRTVRVVMRRLGAY